METMCLPLAAGFAKIALMNSASVRSAAAREAAKQGFLPCLLSVTCVLAVCCLPSVVDAEASPVRLLVLASAPADVGAGAKAALTKQLQDEIPASEHGSIVLVPADELQPALGARRKSADQCRRDRKCVEAVARELAADLVVTASLEHEGKGFQLTIARSAWPQAPAPQSTSARVSSLSSVRLNVRICLGRLFPHMAFASVADLPLISDETPADGAAPTGEAAKPASPAASAGERVVVIAGAPEGVDSKIGTALPEQVAVELAAVRPSRIVAAADVRSVLREREDSAAECLQREYCPAVVASRLDAKLFVAVLLVRSKAGLSLSMTSGNPLRADRQSASEPVKELSGVKAAIRVCLERLFSPAAVSAVPH